MSASGRLLSSPETEAVIAKAQAARYRRQLALRVQRSLVASAVEGPVSDVADIPLAGANVSVQSEAVIGCFGLDVAQLEASVQDRSVAKLTSAACHSSRQLRHAKSPRL